MDKKIRVLQIAFNDLGNGGIQNQIMAIVRNSYNTVINDVVVWSEKPSFYDDEFQKFGKIYRVPHYEGKSYLKNKLDYFTRYFRVKKAIYNILQENTYDVVHSHKLFESAACLSAAHKACVPIRIAHAHLTASKGYKMTLVRFVIKVYNSFYRRIIRKHSTHMIGCSRDAADYVFGKGYGEVVHIGIDIDRFSLSKYTVVPNYNKRLLNVGSFSVHKNQLFLIDVLSELRQIRQDVELELIGRENSYKESVEKKIKDKGLTEYVIFKPHDALIPQEMANADVFVFPSNFEGFGIVLIEAQSIGLTCFASTEVPRETDCGLVRYLELSDGAKLWANQINEFLDMNLPKKPVDTTEFSEKTMVNRLIKIYKSNK